MCDKEDADNALVEQYDIVEGGDDATSGPSEKDVGAGASLEDEAPAAKRTRLALDAYDFPTEYRCPLCHEEFPAAWSLNVHMRTKHLERAHHCRVCNKNFATITDLEQHTLVHQVRQRREGMSCSLKYVAVCIRNTEAVAL
jgi:hypothetical protein